MNSEGADDGSAFARELDELKRRGSNLLVVGTPNSDTRSVACRRLLGEPGSRRCRLFVSTTDAPHTALDDVPPENTRVIVQPNATRSAASAGSSDASLPESFARERYLDTGELDELSGAIGEEIDAFVAEREGLNAGELRLCFDSLVPLVADHSGDEVRRFLTAVGRRVRSVRGMAHYHLPVRADDEHVAALEGAFDAVVHLRTADGRPEQRWVLRAADRDSGWLPL